MKLSELIAYRNQLQKYDIEDIQYQARHKLSDVVHTVKTSVIQPRTFTETIEEDLYNLIDTFNQFGSTLNELIRELDLMIEFAEKDYYESSSARYAVIANNYKTLGEETDKKVDQQILDRRLTISDEAKTMLQNRLKSLADWKCAGLIIRPATESFIDDLVALDPLYLVDYSNELLEPALSKFNDDYKNRLRIYPQLPTDTDLLSELPNNQMGLCLAFNFFEFVSMEVLESYLENIYKKLRPGGTLAMTFNDCDRYHAVELVERHYCFYTPGKRVRAAARKIGYRTQFSWNNTQNVTWLELVKPGTIGSLKGGQALAKIIPKTLAKSK